IFARRVLCSERAVDLLRGRKGGGVAIEQRGGGRDDGGAAAGAVRLRPLLGRPLGRGARGAEDPRAGRARLRARGAHGTAGGGNPWAGAGAGRITALHVVRGWTHRA